MDVLKAAGVIPQPPQVLPPTGGWLEPTGVTSTNDFQLLIPRDASFLVAPITTGSPPSYRNDDGSTDTIPLPFTFRFFGESYNEVYINNNGNISFGQAYGTYTSTGFPTSTFRMVAAFWADVDTRNDTSGLVYYKVSSNRLVVIWDRVGYFGSNADKLNTFEIVITDGTDPVVGMGNNVALSFADMQWTTGDASSGVNGFGGTPATVGLNKGDGASYALIGRFDHPGSDFDGPGGNADGVSYLDGKVFRFNISQGVGTIAGTVYRDLDGDCVRDPGEPGLRGWTVRLEPGPVFTTTDSAGAYLYSFVAPGTYTISEVLQPNWQQFCPPAPGTRTVVLDSGQTRLNQDFGNRPVNNAQDLAVAVSGGVARPGFQKQYGIRWFNRGSTALTASVIFTLPAQVTHLQAAPGGVFASGAVTWNLGTVQPGATGWLWERVQIPASVTLGTVLTAMAVINPTTGDVAPNDNFASEYETVQGSYDPNAIAVVPDGLIDPGDTLEYTIFFQNTGTDTAFTVRLTDSLDTDLDPATVQPGASSHPYTFGITPPAELVFRFDDINLPDSGRSQPLSNGFVTYRVRSRQTLTPGTVIANRAVIFFDFNAGVVTNTVTSTVGGGLAVWPGDATNDGIVDVRDILPLGRFFGLTGAARQTPSLTWTAQALFTPWTPEEASYADCDGNGSVTADDVQGILANWYRTHGGEDAPAVDRTEVCLQLLAELDRAGVQDVGTRALRSAVVRSLEGLRGVPFAFALEQNWPNPFNPSTQIGFTLPAGVEQARVAVYDLLGRETWSAALDRPDAGPHRMVWNGETLSGARAASGVYLVRLTAGGASAVRRMMLVK
jgi:uncharacterized repeat protein (TIGR01451 family)